MISYLLITLNAFLLSLDCSGAPSFLQEAKYADYIALCRISSRDRHICQLNVLEKIIGEGSSDQVFVWGGESDCDENRDEIVGSDGDTILVAVFVLKKQEICDSSYYALEKRAKRNLYFTSECGNNTLSVKNGITVGCITKGYGYIDDGVFKSYQEQEERIPIRNVLDMIHSQIQKQ
jgi:hypothetical protein